MLYIYIYIYMWGFFPRTLSSLSSLGSQARKDLSLFPSVVFGIFTFLRLDTLSPTSVREVPHACLISPWSKVWCTTQPHMWVSGGFLVLILDFDFWFGSKISDGFWFLILIWIGDRQVICYGFRILILAGFICYGFCSGGGWCD